MKQVVAVVGLVLFFASCEPEEKRLLPKPGDKNVSSSQIEMGTTYLNQVYFDLGTGTAVADRIKLDWDLGFETTDDNYIILNGSKLMKVAKTGSTDFAAVTKTTDYEFKADHPSGSYSRNAIGNWQNTDGSSKNEVYVVDRGYDDLGDAIGFVKMQITGLANNTYTIRFAEMDGSNEQTATIVKDNTKNYVNFSFDNPTLFLANEPDKDKWDFVFTQYTEVLWDTQDSVNYLVTGVLTNVNGVGVYIEEDKLFSQITYDYALTLNYNSHRDAIGYDWKVYDFDNAVYYIEPFTTYIIKDTDGEYYKLKFTDFYNDFGEKGAPAFDFQLL